MRRTSAVLKLAQHLGRMQYPIICPNRHIIIVTPLYLTVGYTGTSHEITGTTFGIGACGVMPTNFGYRENIRRN